MRIIISPAKKMNIDTDSFDILGLPMFLKEAERLKSAMQRINKTELQALWKCNSSIAERCFHQLVGMDLYHNLTPSILSYEGIQYQYMAPGVFDYDQLDYINEHLRILSGFYGLLRPFDGVAPYRLEMQTKLSVDGHKDLYSYWGHKTAHILSKESKFILNLASDEYSKAVSSHLPEDVHFLTCTFAQIKDGRLIQKGTLCKMARGRMVRWLAENNVTRPNDIKYFDELGYTFCMEHSTENNMVFVNSSLLHPHILEKPLSQSAK